MKVLQHTRNERNPSLKQNRPDRSYRDTLKCGLRHKQVRLRTTVWRSSKNFRQSSKDPMSCLGGFQILAKQTILFFLTAKLSCYARFLWIKFHWEKDTSVRLYLAWDGRISFIWPFFFWGKQIWAPLLLNVCDSYPGYGYTGSNLENTLLQREILLPSQVSKPSKVTQVLTTTQKVRRKKRIRSCVAIRAIFFSVSSRARWVCDWQMDQLADVWSNDISLMRPRPKFGKRKIIANNWVAKKRKIF